MNLPFLLPLALLLSSFSTIHAVMFPPIPRRTFPEENPQICACLLSFNRLDLLQRTLTSFINHMELQEKGVRYEVIWVDNGSDDKDTLEYISSNFQIEKKVLLNYNSGIAHGLNRMFFRECGAPFILTLEEDWEWQIPQDAVDGDLYPNAVELAIQVLEHDPKVFSVILREEHEFWFTKTQRSPKLFLPNGVEYRHHCLNLKANHVWGPYTNGASLIHAERARFVGPLFGEFTKNEKGEEAKHNGPVLKEKALGFQKQYTEANYSLRVGLNFCSAVLRLVEACDSDYHVDAICNAVFKHTGDNRGHGVDSKESFGTDKAEESWIVFGTYLYDMYKTKELGKSEL